MTAPEEGPAVPLLADALEDAMSTLITEAHALRALSEVAGTPERDSAALLSMYQMKSNLAYRLSLLIDQYRKGKLA